MKIGGARLSSHSSSYYLHLIFSEMQIQTNLSWERFMMEWIPWLRKLWKLLHKRLPLILFLILILLEHVRYIIFTRWNHLNTIAHFETCSESKIL
jgi:hypothetical protein